MELSSSPVQISCQMRPIFAVTDISLYVNVHYELVQAVWLSYRLIWMKKTWIVIFFRTGHLG